MTNKDYNHLNDLYNQALKDLKELQISYDKLQNAWIKQSKKLAEKTQECKKLQKTLDSITKGFIISNPPEPEVIDLTEQYRKALDKIKFEASEELKNLEADTDIYGCLMEILNIINKSKEV